MTSTDPSAELTFADAARPARNERGDRTRAALVDAGAAILVSEGWEGLTHRRVGARANLNPALVKYYFGTTGGMRSAIAQHVSDTLIAPGIQHLGEADGDLAERLVALAGAYASDTAGARLLGQLVTGTGIYPEVAEVIDAAVEAGVNSLTGLVMAATPKMSEQSARAAASTAFALLDGIALQSIAGPAPTLATEAGRDRLRRTFRAILRP